MDSDSLEALRAELNAYFRGQRFDRNKTSSSPKTRSTRVMSSTSLPQAPPVVSHAGMPFTPVAPPLFSPAATHEASGAPASHGFPSVFLKQASTPPFLEAFTPTEFRAWLFEFRAFLARFHLHTLLDLLPPSSPVVRDEGAAVVWFLLQQALKPAATQATPSGRVLQLMLTVLHRRATSPAATIQQLATHLGISTAGEMDMLELTLINFASLSAEPLEQFVWRLHLARDEYNSRVPFYQLPNYSDRKLFKHFNRLVNGPAIVSFRSFHGPPAGDCSDRFFIFRACFSSHPRAYSF
jgi:hypothetical protein